MASGGPERSYMLSAWTGTRWILYGGSVGGPPLNDGMMYTEATDSWEEIPADTSRSAEVAKAVWTGAEFVVWTYGSGGRRFNPQKGTWSDVAPLPSLPGVWAYPSVVWTGDSMIVYGGGSMANGAIYR